MLLKFAALGFTAIVATAGLTACSSDSDTDREAAATSPTAIVSLPPAEETITMTIGQLGEFVVFPDDKDYVIESSNPEVVDVFEGYTDDSGVTIEGPGLIALSVGGADITVYDPEFAGDPFEQFRIFVTEPPSN
jgi:ABC-type Fe3+-hydroxamate transport system substrate-binding protein